MTRQCELLGLPRSSFYYLPEIETPENLGLMRMMDAEHIEHPFLGVRGMTLWLNRATGGDWNPKRVRRLMRKMGLEAIYPKPRTSMPGLGHTIFPYLLRTLDIRKPNQVWCSDITYTRGIWPFDAAGGMTARGGYEPHNGKDIYANR